MKRGRSEARHLRHLPRADSRLRASLLETAEDPQAVSLNMQWQTCSRQEPRSDSEAELSTCSRLLSPSTDPCRHGTDRGLSLDVPPKRARLKCPRGEGADVATRWIRALNDHDLEAAVSCFDEGYRDEAPARRGEVVSGRDEVRRNFERLFADLSRLRAEVLSLAEQGNEVWLEWRIPAFTPRADRRRRLGGERSDPERRLRGLPALRRWTAGRNVRQRWVAPGGSVVALPAVQQRPGVPGPRRCPRENRGLRDGRRHESRRGRPLPSLDRAWRRSERRRYGSWCRRDPWCRDGTVRAATVEIRAAGVAHRTVGPLRRPDDDVVEAVCVDVARRRDGEAEQRAVLVGRVGDPPRHAIPPVRRAQPRPSATEADSFPQACWSPV